MEEKNQRTVRPPESEFFLQWGSRKRLRCVRVRGSPEQFSSDPPGTTTSRGLRRKITSQFLNFSGNPQPSSRLTRNSEAATLRSEQRRPSPGSPEKEERFYATRGSAEENGKGGANCGVVGEEKNGNRGGEMVWPKLYATLTSKEKEEDFMAMKGCKLPHRPKKRAKLIQRTLLLVSPGTWLTDLSIERYEVREKKSSKKRARGLKAMGNFESDSD